MKTHSLILIFAFLCIACDSYEPLSESETQFDPEAPTLHRGTDYPFNTANAYDYTGEVYSDIFNSYYDLPHLPSSLDSIVAFVATEMKAHDYFKAMPSYDVDQFSTVSIDSIIDYPTLLLKQALDSSTLSLAAKDTLETFIDTLILKGYADDDYADLYDFILDYEEFVIDSIDYTAAERTFILTVTSIARHSIYHKDKKPKPNTDPDWDWLTTCIVGSVNGAVHGVPESIDMALKTGIGAR